MISKLTQIGSRQMAMFPSPNTRFLDVTQQTVMWFWKRLRQDELDMQPPYQRNPVWQYPQKASLIDTILRGYPVPELYVQSSITADGDERLTVVDGQQRIRACMEFLADEFALADESEDLAGLRFSQLDEDSRKTVLGYKFVVRALPQMGESEVRDIFGRLNRNNVALNRQELRRATYWGEFISTMDELSRLPFWVMSGLFTSNDIRRMLDIEYVSELAVSALYGMQNKRGQLDYYYGVFETEFPDREEVEKLFDLVLGQLSMLLEWPNRTRWSRKIDFYTLFLVLAENRPLLPLAREEMERISRRLISFSADVGGIISNAGAIDNIDNPRYAHAYARGVRNSSDLGSRRLRAWALSSCLWPDRPIGAAEDVSPTDPHLAKLPHPEELLAVADDDSDEQDDQTEE